MKLQVATAACMAALFMAACGPTPEEQAAAREKAVADSLAAAASKEMTYTLDGATSTVTWAGTMAGIKTHTGTLTFTDGSFTTKGPTLSSGSFTVDMKSYAMTDTNYAPDGSKQGTRANLMGHLMSPDFFAVDSFPTATLKVTSVTGNTASADLTVRGKTNSETITDIVITPNADGTVSASGKLVFDRQKYGVTWSSGSQDAVLKDNIELNVQVTGKAAM
ncbi:MAG: YceI family protein [Flavobacteriales bacterium]